MIDSPSVIFFVFEPFFFSLGEDDDEGLDLIGVMIENQVMSDNQSMSNNQAMSDNQKMSDNQAMSEPSDEW